MGSQACSESALQPLGVVSPQTSPFLSEIASPDSDAAVIAETQGAPPSSSRSPLSRSPASDPCLISSPGSEAIEVIRPPSTEEPNVHPSPLPATFPPEESSSPPSAAAAPHSIQEMGQMVCGSCRQLLAYPQHATCIRCMCCQTVNLVLEAHQVGNIKCEKCCTLLMYPYGAPAVRCSCCRFVTKIGAHNMRPPLSVQQGPPPLPHNPIY